MTAAIGVSFDGTDFNAGTAAIATLAVDTSDKVVSYRIGTTVYVIKVGV